MFFVLCSSFCVVFARAKTTLHFHQWKRKSRKSCILLFKGLLESGGTVHISIQILVGGLLYRFEIMKPSKPKDQTYFLSKKKDQTYSLM